METVCFGRFTPKLAMQTSGFAHTSGTTEKIPGAEAGEVGDTSEGQNLPGGRRDYRHEGGWDKEFQVRTPNQSGETGARVDWASGYPTPRRGPEWVGADYQPKVKTRSPSPPFWAM